MRVLISWSGPTSKAIGEALRDWLPSVIQRLDPYFTPNDIDKGARWLTDLGGVLESSSVGVFCISPDNLQTPPWMAFEAGAISKKLESSRVCVLLFGVTPTQVQGPLAQFQATVFAKEDVWKLIESIHGWLGDPTLQLSTIQKTFERFWPDLEAKIRKILEEIPSGSKAESRTAGDLLLEVLGLVRGIERRLASAKTNALINRLFPHELESTSEQDLADALLGNESRKKRRGLGMLGMGLPELNRSQQILALQKWFESAKEEQEPDQRENSEKPGDTGTDP